jgi:hypothetical protein
MWGSAFTGLGVLVVVRGTVDEDAHGVLVWWVSKGYDGMCCWCMGAVVVALEITHS